MQESIEVGYKPIGPGYNHKYIIYTDSQGNKYGARGGPERDYTSTSGSQSTQSTDQASQGQGWDNSGFGNIKTESGDWSPPHTDANTGERKGFSDYDETNSNARELIKSDTDLSKDWEAIKKAIGDIEKENYEYRPLNQNSNSVVDEALKRAGLPMPQNDTIGEHWSPGSDHDLSYNKANEPTNFPHECTPYDMDGDGIPDAIDRDPSTLPQGPNGDMPQWAKDEADKTYRVEYYDPIALDLNGDGIITTLAEANYTGALFDHDGDGIRTATGWIAKQDGILVRDLNGNGIIDNGKELFGDHTVLKNGQLATSGLQALADLDDNADGVIDAKDQAFNSLKIWQDKNSDGISTADELVTLEAAGITSINVKDKQTVNEKVSGGTIKEQTTFTKTDGTTSKVADINFTNDGVHSKYTETIAVSEAITKLPDLKGFGRLADLHQAAMKSPELANLLEQYSHLTSRTQQKLALDNIMAAWAKTDPLYVNNDIQIIRPENQPWTPNPNSDHVIKLRRGESLPTYITLPPTPAQNADDALENKLKFSESALAFTPSTTYYQSKFDNTKPMVEVYEKTKEALFHSLLSQTILKPYLDSLKIVTNGDRFAEINKLFDTNYHANGIAALEDLKDLLSLQGSTLDSIGWDKGFILLQQWRAELSATSLETKTYIDEMFKDFDIVANGKVQANGVAILNDETQTTFSATNGNEKIIINTQSGKTVYGGDGDDIIVSGKGNDYLIGEKGFNSYILSKGWGQDFINYDNKGAGLDKIVLQDLKLSDVTFYQNGKNLVMVCGDDKVTILGALEQDNTKFLLFNFQDKTVFLQMILAQPLPNLAISDTEEYINGWRGTDILTGNNVDNQIFAFEGNDSLTGNKGDDRLNGGTGTDTYYFSRGDGTDEILESSYATEANHIVFKDINASDIQNIRFEGSDLVLQYSQDDKIILKNYIANSQDSTLTVQFADGKTWQNIDLMAKVTFEGSNESDTIAGTLNDRPNIINAHDGNDIVHGNQTAQNIIDGGDGWDELHGGDNIDTLQGGTGEDFIYGEAGNDHIEGGEDHDTLYGGAGDDTLIGGNGNDWLQGDAGKDTLIGGLGDDSYDVDDLDTFTENANEGYDAIFIARDFDLAGTNLEEIHLKGNGNFKAIGDAGDNQLYGNEGNNLLDGKAGADILAGGAGDDYYIVDKYETLVKNPDGITSYVRGDQVVEGNLMGNYVQGDSGGNDTVEQWDDHHFYRQDATGNWVDTGSYSLLQNNIENLILKGQAKTAFGNELDNTITLNEQNNFVNALGGNDTIIYQKGGGQDTIMSADDTTAIDTLVIQGYDLKNAIFTRLDNTASDYDMLQIRFVGSTDTITLMDYYAPATTEGDGITDNKIDRVVFQNNGNETVLTQGQLDTATVSQHDNHAPTINAQIPVIKVNPSTNLNYQFANNVIIDQDAWDKTLSYKITSMNKDANGQYQPIPSWLNFDPVTQTLTGTPPKDFTGSLSFWYWGTDTFGNGTATSFTVNATPPNQAPTVVNAIADQTANYSTAFNYNIPTTTFKDPEGDALSYTATLEDGSALPSWLVFNASTRTFSGTAPQSSNPVNVKVTATDTFKNSVSDVFTINFAAPNLTINGTANADTLTGKEGNDTLNGLAGNDTLIGGAGDDKLDGGAGADKLNGGTGNDTYVVDNVGDVITENANEGTDTVQSSITYTLGNNLENLTLIGTTAINGTGNALDNTIVGNSAINTLTGGAGNDTLDGGAGADKLLGGTGNDTYVVDNTGDVITENANEGTDTVQSSITYSLGSNLENLTLTGTTAINGTGNTLDNTLIGNSAANTLTGGAGNDTLDGGLGNDVLIGGAGNDIYIYRANQGSDSIDNTGGGTDTINFADANDSQLSYHKDGNDLVILIDKDLTQQVRVKNHFVTTTDTAIDMITTKNGMSISAVTIANNLTALPGKVDMSGDNILKDTLGNDTLAGEAGNDTYYHTGGKDVIVDTAGVDKLIFANGITYNQVGSGLMQSGNDLVLRVDGSTTNEVTLTNFFKDANSIVETISFESGGSMTAQEIYSLFGKTLPQSTTPVVTAPAIQGDANNNDLIGKTTDDTIQGLAGNDRLQGLAGNDTLEGGAGNDILVGGAGNDTLTGGTGNDMYYFKAGFGQDTIVNTGGGVDNIYFDGLTFNQLSQGLMKSGNDLTLKVSGSTDQVTIKDFFLGGENAGLNISFASGGSLTSDQIFGAYGMTNPSPSANKTSDYQTTLSSMLTMMSDLNKTSPLVESSAVI